MSVSWIHHLEESIVGEPVLAEDRLAIGTADGELRVLDRDDGEVQWEAKTPAGIVGGLTYDSYVLLWAGEDGGIYRCPLDDYLPATDIEVRYRLECPPAQHPTKQRTFMAGEGWLTCLAGNYRATAWSAQVQGSGPTWLTVEALGPVVASGAHVTAFETDAPTGRWQAVLTSPVVVPPVAVDDRAVVVTEAQTLFEVVRGDARALATGVLPVRPRVDETVIWYATPGGVRELARDGAQREIHSVTELNVLDPSGATVFGTARGSLTGSVAGARFDAVIADAPIQWVRATDGGIWFATHDRVGRFAP